MRYDPPHVDCNCEICTSRQRIAKLEAVVDAAKVVTSTWRPSEPEEMWIPMDNLKSAIKEVGE